MSANQFADDTSSPKSKHGPRLPHSQREGDKLNVEYVGVQIT